MPYRMGDLRNLGFNLYYYLASGLNSNGYIAITGLNQAYVNSGVYLVNSYPEDFDNLKTPTISIDNLFTSERPLQVGPGRNDVRRYEITIYGSSKGSRDDLGELVRNMFHRSINYYDYNLIITGGSHISYGIINFDNITLRPIRDLSFESTKYQAKVTFECEIMVPSGNSII